MPRRAHVLSTSRTKAVSTAFVPATWPSTISIKRIAEQNRPFAANAEGAKAETGDRVTISFKGTIDGTPFDGGAGENIQVTIGAAQFIPGFEEQLVGMTAGETRTLKVSFPKNY